MQQYFWCAKLTVQVSPSVDIAVPPLNWHACLLEPNILGGHARHIQHCTVYHHGIKKRRVVDGTGTFSRSRTPRPFFVLFFVGMSEKGVSENKQTQSEVETTSSDGRHQFLSKLFAGRAQDRLAEHVEGCPIHLDVAS